jgi:exopolysaccharide production protein ExoZ
VIVSVQYLRALAATGVVLHHAVGPAFIRCGRAAPGTIGEAGVDLFFVISGLIMWVTTSRRETSPGDFISHRLIRIVPLYWICTFAFLAITAASTHAAPIDAGDVIRSLLFIPAYDAALAQKTSAFFFLGWTLMYEMFFYGVFATALLLPRAAQLPAIIGTLMILVGLGAVASFDGGLSFTYTSPLLLEFAAGCMIGKLYEKQLLPSGVAGATIVLIGAGILALTVWYFPENLHQRTILWGIPSALVVFGTLSLEKLARRKPSRILLLLGDASYSIYLSHIIILLMFNVVIQRLGIFSDFEALLATYLVAGGAVALIAGMIVYELVERPVLRVMRRAVPVPRLV